MTGWLHRHRNGRDEGAVATVVALLLAGGVLLGALALVIDVGQIFVERRELQAGADAAALGVAKACAADTANCDDYPAIQAQAQKYADLNSSDGISFVATVCGVLNKVLPDCPLESANLTACLGSPPSDRSYVEVRLSTELPGNRFVLPPSFAQTLAGHAADEGTSVGACARAAWKEPVVVRISALAMSTCDFNNAPVVSPPPPPIPVSRQTWLGDGSLCLLPVDHGGVLGATAGPCEILMPDNHVAGGDLLTTNPFPVTCVQRLRDAMSASEALYLPVYNSAIGLPGHLFFHITRLAKVVVTGFRVGPAPTDIVGTPPSRCTGSGDICVGVAVVGELDLSSLVADPGVDLVG